MTNQDILCQIRDKQPPYGYCVDGDGDRSRTRVLSRTYISRGGYITELQCNENADHKFKIDHEGNVINE